MAHKTVALDVLKGKFKGCMVGALMGDCLGEPFEFSRIVEKEKLNNFFVTQAKSSGTLRYTDDSSMMMSIASSLVDKGKFDSRDMAEKFVEDYSHDPSRGYGANVQRVFLKLHKSKCSDVFLPAKQQFDGSGSYGNGGAMRIAPIALFGNNLGEEYVMTIAEESARITHTHPLGVNGAVLQCLAVNAALNADPSKDLDPVQFVDHLLDRMKQLETEAEKQYCEKLEKIKNFLLHDQELTPTEIVQYLGNAQDESAIQAVPTAIYSFLRSLKPIEDFESSNPFLRTLYSAISVGGDTDTIACMACGIAGAYYGIEMIPEVYQGRCEAIDKVTKLAEDLFDMIHKN